MFTFSTYGSSHVAISFNLPGLSSAQRFEVNDITFHLSNAAKPNGTVATAANTLTIKKLSQKHQNCNALIKSVPMSGVGDFHFKPAKPVPMQGNDSLSIAWTNDAASFKNWGINIDFEVK